LKQKSWVATHLIESYFMERHQGRCGGTSVPYLAILYQKVFHWMLTYTVLTLKKAQRRKMIIVKQLRKTGNT